ncbi:hypothetical protein MMC20_004691 [Loxospora ochrophaea]|nr:hypothetical protein [Loxospora ochrophaea]
MKLLTTNFLTCAVKACKSSPAAYPLHFRDAELEQLDMEFNPQFIINILPRLDWEALRGTAAELGFTTLPAQPPSFPPPPAATATTDDAPQDPSSSPTSPASPTSTNAAAAAAVADADIPLLKDLHTLLLETSVVSGSLVCGNCGHEYRIKEGIANFLLPGHLGE